MAAEHARRAAMDAATAGDQQTAPPLDEPSKAPDSEPPSLGVLLSGLWDDLPGLFSDRVHPARQMLNILANAGFNWLEGGDADDGLQGSLAGILGNTVKDFDGDSRQLLAGNQKLSIELQKVIVQSGYAAAFG